MDPLSLIQSNQKKKIPHNETFGILTSQFPSWLGPFGSFTLSHIISSANPLPAPPPPQIDEYSRCAYVVHRCVVVSSATKGPMHVTFKVLFLYYGTHKICASHEVKCAGAELKLI